MELYTILEKQLKREQLFINDRGELKKRIIVSYAENADPLLLGNLLENSELKKAFFLELKGTHVFDHLSFIQFVEQKNYLNDSYTSYRNKVGLSVNGRYLGQDNNLELVWPFKDCVLEGGQSREENKREEIFFNSILARDEITQLFEPKVFTNGKRFNADGKIQLEGFNTNEAGKITDNLIIKGNNLLSLHSLRSRFAGTVKLIYIDPPYNTGSDSFGYNDSFRHSSWLTFMKNRLEAAKNLLAPTGVILVQCSFHQFAYLKIMMGEIFEKHLCDFHIQVRHPDRVLTGDKEFNDVIEYILVFSNDASGKMPYREELKTIDEYALEVEIADDAVPETIVCDNKMVEVFTPEKYRIKIVPPSENGLKKISIRGSIREKNSSGRFFVKHLENLKGFPPETLFRVPDMGDDRLNHRFFYSAPQGKKNGGYYQGMPQSSAVTKKPYPNFFNFEKEYNNVRKEGSVDFRNGKKPEELLKMLVEMFTSEKDLVLDYHVGSGTTAAVCHKLNRQYIGMEQMSNQAELTVERLRNVIGGDHTGISKTTEWKGGGEFVYLELKKFNEEFIEIISEITETAELIKVWEEMKQRSFLNYNVDLKKHESQLQEFNLLSIEEQKAHLSGLLDMNQLYVNVSSLEDAEFKCSEQEKKITKSFYQL